MTRNARRSSASSRPRLLSAPAASAAGAVLAAAVLALAVPIRAALPSPGAEEVEDLAGSIEKYRGVLTLANQKLENLELPEALAAFTEVIEAYQTGRLSATSPPARQLVGQAYEGRARTHANLGRNPEAEADYEALVRFDLTWPVDRERTSPKIIALYDRARGKLVGTLAVRTEPPGALLALDGRPAGRSPLFDQQVLAGGYMMSVEAPGFEPLSEPVTIQGGARTEKVLALTPNARSVLLTTSPAGARVSVDGQERGATFGEAGPEYAGAAAALGLAPGEVSAPLLLEHLPPGAHLLRIEKECHEPLNVSIEVAIDPNGNAPLRLEPLRLTPSLGNLALESLPSGAEVLLDGVPSGRTPVRLPDLCSGAHQIVMRRPDLGQWIGTATVARGQTASAKQALRPTLAYVGMTVAGPAGQPPAGERDLGEALARLASFNVVGPGGGLPDAMLARARGASGSSLEAGYVAEVAAATGADLVLAARPSEGAFEQKVEVLLHAARYPLSDRRTLSLRDAAQIKRFVDLLDERPRLTAPWLGLSAIETHRSTNPTAIRVPSGGPAAAAGARPGDRLVALGGRGLATVSDLESAVGALAPGTRASLTLQAPGREPRVVNVTMGATPVLPAHDDPDRLVSWLAAQLSFRARLEAALDRRKSLEGTSALLGLGVLLMNAGQYRAALEEAFDRASLPPGPGISGGTASYLRALCLLRLGRAEEARRWLLEAAAQPDATLGSHGGPPVAERARRLLEGSAGL